MLVFWTSFLDVVGPSTSPSAQILNEVRTFYTKMTWVFRFCFIEIVEHHVICLLRFVKCQISLACRTHATVEIMQHLYAHLHVVTLLYWDIPVFLYPARCFADTLPTSL